MGTVIWFASSTPPTGYLECNGQSTSGYPALAAIVGAYVPDLRGRFIRGWNHDGIDDIGRTFYSYQSDEIKSHNHLLYAGLVDTHSPFGSSVGGRDYNSGSLPTYYGAYTTYTGGAETRPKNIALLPCIRALP